VEVVKNRATSQEGNTYKGKKCDSLLEKGPRGHLLPKKIASAARKKEKEQFLDWKRKKRSRNDSRPCKGKQGVFIKESDKEWNAGRTCWGFKAPAVKNQKKEKITIKKRRASGNRLTDPK